MLPRVRGVLLLAAGAVVLSAAGRDALATPSVLHGGAWRAWWRATPPVDATFAIGRVALLAACTYLFVISLLVLIGRTGRAARLLGVPFAARVLPHLAGAGLLAASLAPSPAAAAEGDVVVMRLLDDGSPPVPAPAFDEALAAAPAPPLEREWTVERGDHFWSIAERVLAEARGRPVADGEVDAYWRHLVDVNRDRLAVPGVPDLLYAGQVLRIPPP